MQIRGLNSPKLLQENQPKYPGLTSFKLKTKSNLKITMEAWDRAGGSRLGRSCLGALLPLLFQLLLVSEATESRAGSGAGVGVRAVINTTALMHTVVSHRVLLEVEVDAHMQQKQTPKSSDFKKYFSPKSEWACCRPCLDEHLPVLDDMFGKPTASGDPQGKTPLNIQTASQRAADVVTFSFVLLFM
jgi:hypothetical protein